MSQSTLNAVLGSSRRSGISSSEIEDARRAIGPRATASMIARYLGRCVADVQGILNPPSGAKTVATEGQSTAAADKSDERFRELWTKGVTVSDLSVMFETSHYFILRRRVLLGLPERGKNCRYRWSPENDDAAIACETAEDYRDLAERLGSTADAVRFRAMRVRKAQRDRQAAA